MSVETEKRCPGSLKILPRLCKAMLPTSTANNKDQNKGEMSTYKGTVPFWKGEVTGTGERERERHRYKQLLKNHAEQGHCCLPSQGHQLEVLASNTSNAKTKCCKCATSQIKGRDYLN